MARRTITGLSPIAEQVTQERMMLIASVRIERAMRTELSRTYAELTRTAGDTGATAGVIAAHGERVASILVANWTNIWSQFGRRILTGAMKHAKPEMEVKRDMPLTPLFDQARQKWIQLFGALKVTQITSTTKEQAEKIINQAIADAVSEGLSEIDTAALLRERMREAGAQLSRLRSRVIARTESHNASTAATQAAAESSEVPMKREWVASMGERTRDDHREANGQLVGMYEPFKVGGESLMYPGDPNGSAEQVINCRCVVAYIPD